MKGRHADFSCSIRHKLSCDTNLPYKSQGTAVTHLAQFQKLPAEDCLNVEDDPEMSRNVRTTDLRCVTSQKNEDLVLKPAFNSLFLCLTVSCAKNKSAWSHISARPYAFMACYVVKNKEYCTFASLVMVCPNDVMCILVLNQLYKPSHFSTD